jgi:hypothetical protein
VLGVGFLIYAQILCKKGEKKLKIKMVSKKYRGFKQKKEYYE